MIAENPNENLFHRKEVYRLHSLLLWYQLMGLKQLLIYKDRLDREQVYEYETQEHNINNKAERNNKNKQLESNVSND